MLDKRATLATVKRLFHSSAHWECARGTPQENKTYCTKSESAINGPWEFGTLPEGHGSRTDLKSIYELVKAEKTNGEMLTATDGKSAKFERHINYIRFTLNEDKSDRQLVGVKVIVIYGETDVGKTYAAVNYFGNNDYHIQECPSSKETKLWFDGYQGQRTLILDDFSGDFCQFRYLLRVLDKYKLKVEIKGAHAWALWTTVVITTNVHPANWYSSVNVAPLRRRINEIRYMPERGMYQLMDWTEQRQGDIVPFTKVTPAVPVEKQGDTISAADSTSSTSTSADTGIARKRVRMVPPLRLPQEKEKEKEKDVMIVSSNEELTDPDANHDPDLDVRTVSPTQSWPMGAQPM